MRHLYLTFFFVFFTSTLLAQEFPAYRIYKSNGEATDFNELLSATDSAEVILFGELHNSALAHWLQLELLKATVAKTRQVVLGMEMFERDNQLMLDEYYSGLYDDKKFEAAVRLWPNYATDYKPLVDYAIGQQVRVVGTNIPRRYASMVARNGFEVLNSLSVQAQKYLPPLPVPYDPELSGYKKMLAMGKEGPMQKHVNANFPKAQAIKDATMAYYLIENLPEEAVMLHIHGTYHSDNYQGIYWYLKRYNSTIRVVTIAARQQADIGSLEEQYRRVADFIFVVDEDFTTTY